MLSVTSSHVHNLIPLAVTSTIPVNSRTKQLTTLDTTDYISAVSSKTMKVGFNTKGYEAVYRHYFKVSLVNVKELPDPGELQN